MQIQLTRLVVTMIAPSLSLTACNWLHHGPDPAEIDYAVRQALETENAVGMNALAGNLLPTSDDVASVKPEGECTNTGSTGGAQIFTCSVSIVLTGGQSSDVKTTRHAVLRFTPDGDGHWQTSGVDRAIAAGAATSFIDRAGRALSWRAASSPQ